MKSKTHKLIATALTGLLLAACGGKPSGVVEQFYMAVSEGKIQESMSYMDIEGFAGRGLSPNKIRAGLTQSSHTYNKVDCGGLKEVKVTSEEIRGDIAHLKFTLVCKSGKTKDESSAAIKTKDGWKLTVK